MRNKGEKRIHLFRIDFFYKFCKFTPINPVLFDEKYLLLFFPGYVQRKEIAWHVTNSINKYFLLIEIQEYSESLIGSIRTASYINTNYLSEALLETVSKVLNNGCSRQFIFAIQHLFPLLHGNSILNTPY